jgi:hypothetical protein
VGIGDHQRGIVRSHGHAIGNGEVTGDLEHTILVSGRYP